MKDKDLPAFVYGDLKREELARTGSVVLHEQYFGNLGGAGNASGAVLDLIKQWFGSYEQWEAEFKRTANALGGGSGWGDAVLQPAHRRAAQLLGHGTICITRQWGGRYLCWICTSTRTIWTTARRQ